MPDAAQGKQVVQLRLIVEAAPPEEHEGRWTEFGLQDKTKQLHLGKKQPDGSFQFDLSVEAKRDPLTGTPRFTGPFVQGTPSEPFLYLSWKYFGEPPQWIRRQKIPLKALTWEHVEQAEEQGQLFQAAVPPITGSTATVPVEWTLLSA